MGLEAVDGSWGQHLYFVGAALSIYVHMPAQYNRNLATVSNSNQDARFGEMYGTYMASLREDRV
jgi:hypothetical protein